MAFKFIFLVTSDLVSVVSSRSTVYPGISVRTNKSICNSITYSTKKYSPTVGNVKFIKAWIPPVSLRKEYFEKINH